MSKMVSGSEVGSIIDHLIDETARRHEPIIISGNKHNAVLLSLEDWRNIQETLNLYTIPGLTESIKKEMKSPDHEFSDTIEW